MRIIKNAAVAAAVAATALGGAALGAGSATAESDGVIVIQGTCGDKRDVSVTGGKASWTLSCTKDGIRAQGWVKDTLADGRSAQVYGTWADGDSFGTVTAGGVGTVKDFDKAHDGNSVSLYLRVR